MGDAIMLEIPRDVLHSTGVTIPELKVELAVYIHRITYPSARRANWPA
jgi:hypothetical protein